MFAAVIAIFAISVRLSFITVLEDQVTKRLVTLARAGSASVAFTNSGFIVNDKSLGGFEVNPQTESLDWFDSSKHRVAHRGIEYLASAEPHIGSEPAISVHGKHLDTQTLLLKDLQGHDRGYVRAAHTIDGLRKDIGALDLGIALGSVLAIIAASIGGTALARAGVARVEASYERLREFTADASHELRGPLAALSTTAAVALREAPQLEERTRERLVSISTIADQMRRLVDDLLILARSERSLEREMFVVPLEAIMQRIYERYQTTALVKSIDFRVAKDGQAKIIGNPEQITRIISNLVDNALLYTPAGGAVRVSCRHDASHTYVSVEDTGAGIPPEYLERIFDRFWRGANNEARSNDGGTGLGLAIARALTERHGGRLTVSSKVREGTTFTLVLPQRPPSLS